MHSSTKYAATWTKLHVLVFHAPVVHFTSSAVRDAPLQYGRGHVRSPMWIQVGSVCIGHCITRSSAQIPTSPVLVICKLSCENPFAAITFYACGPSVNSFRKSRCSGFTHFNFRCQLKLNTQLRIKLCSTCTSRIRVFFFRWGLWIYFSLNEKKSESN